MNIKEAKEEIRNSIFAYFTKNEFGEEEIPIERQRPLLLMGPPGIGKTAVMEQISQELGVGLVSYSMSHHTRQSALGLPYIVTKTYGGTEYKVSEYTMSEIIAAVYDMMADTQLEEGILFLDEINCVSETLAPAMLEFLQYKTFGRHRVPDGWIVVTAGNPPEYNNSVREMDIVTWDRLKRIDVEPDYSVWKEYAVSIGVHPAVTTYLDIKKNDFYSIETTADGKTFVTARGWVDLSSMLRIYEKRGFKVNERLVRQYLQNDRIAKDFAVYYDLFNKYRSDYQVDKILAGDFTGDIKTRAKAAPPDERLSLLGLILSSLGARLKELCLTEDTLGELAAQLKELRPSLESGKSAEDALSERILGVKAMIDIGKRSSVLSGDRHYTLNKVIAFLREMKELPECAGEGVGGAEVLAALKNYFQSKVTELKDSVALAKGELSNVFKFCEVMFGMDSEGNSREMIILVTELALNSYCARFISRYGCDEYFAHDDKLVPDERYGEVMSEVEKLDL